MIKPMVNDNFKGEGDEILNNSKGKFLKIQGSTDELLKPIKVDRRQRISGL